jgi:NhaP-type Na+/H+ or K+/H+ antiporter
MSLEDVGGICFGVVIGWIVYRTLRRAPKTGISDVATVIGAVGGGAVTGIFDTPDLFAWYSIGLAAGFFGYLVLGHTVFKNSAWLGGE